MRIIFKDQLVSSMRFLWLTKIAPLVGSVLMRDALNSVVMGVQREFGNLCGLWWSSSRHWWQMAQRICTQDWSLWCSSCRNLRFVLGLELAWSDGISHLYVESDSKLLIDMVTNNCKTNGTTPSLIWRIINILGVEVHHTWREDNKIAYWLVNFSPTMNSWNFGDPSQWAN